MDLRPNNDGVSLDRVAATVGAPDLDAGQGGTAVELASIIVRGICVDSRKIQAGDLFAALPGENVHGARFAEAAVRDGAVALLTDRAGAALVGPELCPMLIVADPRAQVGAAASQIYGDPSADLLLFAVTGTNGKTTTTWLLEAGLREAGHITGLVGTVETRIAGAPVPSVRTTPEAPELHALLAVMRERGVTAVAIEVSSHALALGRVDGCLFDVAGFTQFGSDHLDFHGTVDHYFNAKARLFTPDHARAGVVCVDSAGGRRLLGLTRIPTTSLSTDSRGSASQPGDRADWQVSKVTSRASGGYAFTLSGPGQTTSDVAVALPGRFNIANASLALAMLQTAGVDEHEARTGIEKCRGVPGRMEAIDGGQGFVALVDYAHTPDALDAVLTSLRPDVAKRLIVVMGCGGDRDPTKRGSMGEVAATLGDIVIVTDDNPRFENPAAIRAAVLAGARSVMSAHTARIEEIAGRAKAMARAVAIAGPGDAVVVAGKGHEQGQEIDGHVYPFDDRVVLREALLGLVGNDDDVQRGVGGGVEANGLTPEDRPRPQEEK
ncbi:MAG TPA: UDP-N-acetylmuramoyl-L-alanyl-D-glutamate--2,6-diaminopimelate ligase [Actinomycetes bacterium]|nr:UDP-N-acetylmuramoyl-L-alanyl-D-glutamate--2,6-diaminopimelate ligase [Actinomycetes bacterium]